jgi:hypothetical protein
MNMRSFNTFMACLWVAIAINPLVKTLWRMTHGRPLDDYVAYVAWFVAAGAMVMIHIHRAQDD